MKDINYLEHWAEKRLRSDLTDKLQEMDEERLFEELGMRVSFLVDDPESPVDLNKSEFFRFAPIGRTIFRRVGTEVRQLVCGDKDLESQRERIKDALNVGKPAAIAALVPVIVGGLAVAPPVALAIAAIAVFLFVNFSAKVSLEIMCSNWEEWSPAQAGSI